MSVAAGDNQRLPAPAICIRRSRRCIDRGMVAPSTSANTSPAADSLLPRSGLMQRLLPLAARSVGHRRKQKRACCTDYRWENEAEGRRARMLASARPSPAPGYATRAPASKPLPPPPPPRSTSAPSILKRLTTKLRPPQPQPLASAQPRSAGTPTSSTTSPTVIPGTSSGPSPAPNTLPTNSTPSSSRLTPQAQPSKPKRLSTLRLALPKAPAPARAQSNDFLDPAARAAALRERGLRPPKPTLSEQEAALDRRHSVLVPLPEQSKEAEETEARRIREAWMRQNRVSESAEGLLDDEDENEYSEDGMNVSEFGVPDTAEITICTNDAVRASPTLVVPSSSSANAVSAHASPGSFVFPLPASPRRGSTSTRRTTETDASSRSRSGSVSALGASAATIPGLSTSLSTSSTGASVPRTPWSAAPSPSDALSKTLPEKPHEGVMMSSVGIIAESPVEEPEEMVFAVGEMGEMGPTVEAQVLAECEKQAKKPSRVWRTTREPSAAQRTTPALTVTVHPPPRPSSSLTNLRRAVASVARRPKSLVSSGSDTKFDPRTLPASPTFPPSAYQVRPSSSYPSPSPSEMSSLGAPSSYHSASSPTSSTFAGAGMAVPRPRPRQALSPTIHSRGSILLETKGIADAESRRLSEMAFLDY
ncbi:hypothetical protein OBBRIDRAFT_806661 [Obba rivulosa]|uniref:Uncharacterized protein n=1 Tax=Obba rivulosa TaxID=1052685 RepID=A0A8E2DL91_9APHY|nr:hypothetical protein OBBRIDRAFT_806661 [Obba rivulosa]